MKILFRTLATCKVRLWRRGSGDAVDAELEHHVEESVDLLVEQGMDRDSARREALRRFGSVRHYRNECERISRRSACIATVSAAVDTLGQDVRYAVRSLVLRPGFTVAAVFSLALGIGANTAIFSITDSLLLRKLPVKDPHRLSLVSGGDRPNWSYDIWEQIRARPDLFEGAFAWQPDRLNLANGGQTDFVEGIYASGEFFEVLGIPAVIGRLFDQADDRRGGGEGGPVAVISFGFWQRRYGGTTDVIGQSLQIEGVHFTIVGVTPPKFFGPDVGRRFDIVVPLETEPLVRGRQSLVVNTNGVWLGIMARLKQGQTFDAAATVLRSVQPHIREATLPHFFDEQRQAQYMVRPWTLEPAAAGRSSLRGRFQHPLLVLMGVVSFVLLIACANVASLMLVRAASRRHELSVRKALGASRLRIARQCLMESFAISVLGTASGVVLAKWGSDLLVHQLSTANSAVFLDLSIDARVLLFSAFIAVATTALFGTAPAIHSVRTKASDAFKEGILNRGGSRRIRTYNLLVVAQVALSLVLVIAAGLFVRTFSALATLDTGFDRNRVLVVDVDAKNSEAQPTERLDLVDRVRQTVATTPGVATAAVGMKTPVSPGGIWMLNVAVADGASLSEGDRFIYANYVTPEWFATFGTNLRAGRDFTDSDGREFPVVAIVNQAFAVRFLGGQNPVGRYLLNAEFDTPIEVVGLVDDVTYRSLREPAAPMVYLPLAERTKASFRHDPPLPISVSVRAEGESPSRLISAVVAAIGQVEATFALTLRPLSDDFDARLVQERLLAILSGMFGALALLLAGLGLFGVASYAVSQRRAEMGIRLALGAAPRRVARMVYQHIVLLVGAGITIGGALSLWATRFAESLLFGLDPRDPVTFMTATALLAGVGALAGWLPARRASLIDPKTYLGGL